MTKSLNVVPQHHALQDCTFATLQRATRTLLLFTACPDHYRNPCKDFGVASQQQLLAPLSYSALVWPPGTCASGAQTLYPNVNPCLNDIVNLNECYSDWPMGNSHPVLEGEGAKQTHLPCGEVWSAPIGAISYSALWSCTWKPSKITTGW